MEKDENMQEQIFRIQAIDQLTVYLIRELAWARKIEVWIDNEVTEDGNITVCLRGVKLEIDALIKAAGPGTRMIQALRLNLLAAAVITAGNRPSDELLKAIEQMREVVSPPRETYKASSLLDSCWPNRLSNRWNPGHFNEN